MSMNTEAMMSINTQGSLFLIQTRIMRAENIRTLYLLAYPEDIEAQRSSSIPGQVARL